MRRPLEPSVASRGKTEDKAPLWHSVLDRPLAALFDAASDGVLAFNSIGHRVYANAALNELVGSDARRPLGTTVPPPYLPIDQLSRYNRVLEGMSSLLAAGGAGNASTSLELFGAGRRRLLLRLSVSVLTAPGGGRFGIWLLKPFSAESVVKGTWSKFDRVPASPTTDGDPVASDKRSIASLPGTEALSQREKDVLSLLLDGRRVSSIARSLYLSEHTVRNHLKAIFRKIGTHSQAELLDRLRPIQGTGPARYS